MLQNYQKITTRSKTVVVSFIFAAERGASKAPPQFLPPVLINLVRRRRVIHPLLPAPFSAVISPVIF